MSLLWRWFGHPSPDSLLQKNDVKGLLKLIEPEYPPIVRKQAVGNLGLFRRREVVQAILALLPSEDADLRLAMVQTLGSLRDPVSVDPLIRQLEGHDPIIAAAAATALSKIADPRCVGPLVRRYIALLEGEYFTDWREPSYWDTDQLDKWKLATYQDLKGLDVELRQVQGESINGTPFIDSGDCAKLASFLELDYWHQAYGVFSILTWFNVLIVSRRHRFLYNCMMYSSSMDDLMGHVSVDDGDVEEAHWVVESGPSWAKEAAGVVISRLGRGRAFRYKGRRSEGKSVQMTSRGDDLDVAEIGCSHGALAPIFLSEKDIGDEARATGFRCGDCGKMFTVEQGRIMRSKR
jgi:hypothetical protein